jgi:hypothetical protein
MPYLVRLLFAFFLAFSFASCGSDDGDSNPTTTLDDNNDTISGNEDDDTISGNEDDDTISGNEDDDTISGNEDDDTISGNEDDDTISGNEDDDTTSGNGSDDAFEDLEKEFEDGNSAEEVDDGFIAVDEVSLKAIVDEEFNQTIGFEDNGSGLSWFFNGTNTYADAVESCENRGERLPTIHELVRIIDPMTEKGVPELLEEYFPVDAVIWTSTLEPVENENVLIGKIYYGVDIFETDENASDNYVLCVSGTNKSLGLSASDRNISKTDDVITDPTFRLVWEDSEHALEQMSYEDAKIHCANLDLQEKDWRLPTFRELYSIVDINRPDTETPNSFDFDENGKPVNIPPQSNPSPKIYDKFKNIPKISDEDTLLNYWTSTEKFGEDRAWTVKFGDGRNNYPLKSDSAYVRCVADSDSYRDLPPVADENVIGNEDPLPTFSAE